MQRWRSARWVLLALVVIVGVATLSTYLTAPRPGGPMDPESTSPEGARALVTILREHGVDVIAAGDIAAVERAARPDTLILVAQTFYLFDDDLLRRLAALPGDRLLVEPVSRTREALAPQIRLDGATTFGDTKPDCDMREATRAGEVQFGLSDAYEAAGDVPVTRCYGGALVRYADDGREVTVVSTAEFHDQLRPAQGRQRRAGDEPRGIASAGDLVRPSAQRRRWRIRRWSNAFRPHPGPGEVDRPAAVPWSLRCWRCGRADGSARWSPSSCLWWSRASETVEGRGRLYRSRRARDRAAEALRTATLQRMMPRLGLGHDAEPPAVAQAVAERCGLYPQAVAHTLFGPPPANDPDLVNLAHELDNIERQVAQS